jgi:hypothetical protein
MTSSNSSSAESIGHDQLDLASYSSPATFDTLEDRHQDSEGEHSDHRTGIETATERAREEDALPIEVARRAEYIGFLHRAPFATEAFSLGFVTGAREDCRIQDSNLRNVDIPILMLDNDFNKPDLDRYLTRFREVKPEIGVVGDARTPEDAHTFVNAARDLKAEYPDATLIIVPKCREAIDIVANAEVSGESLVLGYAMGRSDTKAWHFSDIADWRGHRVHLLGASPPKQWRVIQELTQPNLTGDPPADIIGLDWNGPQGIAYKGESWSREGWQDADFLTIRETVHRSLREMRAFWEERGVWPADGTTPVERLGLAVKEPDDPIWAANGGDLSDPDSLGSPDEWAELVDYEDEDGPYPIEQAIVVTYEDGRTLAYRTQTERNYVEYHEGLWGKIVDERA